MTDKYEEGWLAAVDAATGEPAMKFKADANRRAISVLRERFVPRVEGPHDALIERLGHASAGLRSHFKPGAIELIPADTMDEAAAALASLQAQLAARDEALRSAVKHVSDLSLQAGEAIGRLEASEMAGVVEGWREKCESLQAQVERVREALKLLRDGYADAVSGYNYILQQHGRLSGVGFDRVMDHFFQWVTIPEREGLLAGSHTVPARQALSENPHD